MSMFRVGTTLPVPPSAFGPEFDCCTVMEEQKTGVVVWFPQDESIVRLPMKMAKAWLAAAPAEAKACTTKPASKNGCTTRTPKMAVSNPNPKRARRSIPDAEEAAETADAAAAEVDIEALPEAVPPAPALELVPPVPALELVPAPASAPALAPAPAPAPGLAPPAVAATAMASLSTYEEERLANIARNQAALSALGLERLAPPNTKAPRLAQPRRTLPRPVQTAPARSSSRLAELPRRSLAETAGDAPAAEWRDPTALDLAPGTRLETPTARSKRKRPLTALTPPPLLTLTADEAVSVPMATPEEQAAAQVEAQAKARARYKEVFLHVRKSTDGGRADLKAMKAVREEGYCGPTGSWAGAAGEWPGVPVGAEFYNKAEMSVVGMHRKWLSGIDYVSAKESETGESYATCVVSSGGYEDDEDDGDELWYTGEGGNDLLSSRRQVGSQQLKGGNEALVNNCATGTPVRLVRFVGNNFPEERSFSGRLYIYDGLYDVVEHIHEVGTRQHGVFKFRL